MEIGLDEDDEVTDIREQMFHNTVREQIVSYFLIIFLSQKKHLNPFKKEDVRKKQEKQIV